MTPICFYHSADLDGKCSAAIVNYFVPDVDLYPFNYGDEFPWDKAQGNVVFMVDISLPANDMARLAQESQHLFWIDHHKTAIDEILPNKDLPMTTFCFVGFAACELTWMFFEHHYNKAAASNVLDIKNEWVEAVPLAIKLLGHYDVWNKTDIELWDDYILPFQYGMRNTDNSPHNIDLWYPLLLNNLPTCSEITENGKAILSYQRKQNERVVKSLSFEGHVTALEGMRAICCNQGLSNSQLFDAVWDPEKHDIMVTFVWKPKHRKWLYSLYSTKEDVDCGAIAKKYGGGGHKGAAGFEHDELLVVPEMLRDD